MSRILLIGRAGSGKTHACLERLVERRGKLCLLLVPTYSQAEHLRYALLDRLGGVSQRLIHTFTSLAERFGDCRLGELVSESRRDRLAAAHCDRHQGWNHQQAEYEEAVVHECRKSSQETGRRMALRVGQCSKIRNA